jgi:ATP-dependent DNA ligase
MERGSWSRQRKNRFSTILPISRETTLRISEERKSGRNVGAGIDQAELERLCRLLQTLAKMPLDTPPPRGARFGSPLVLSRVHWARPVLVVEVKYLTSTGDNLLRQVVYEGLRKDKPPIEVRPEVPHPSPAPSWARGP